MQPRLAFIKIFNSVLYVTRDLVDNNNIALLIVGLPYKEKSDQPEDGP
jgi:hypothetical protein